MCTHEHSHDICVKVRVQSSRVGSPFSHWLGTGNWTQVVGLLNHLTCPSRILRETLLQVKAQSPLSLLRFSHLWQILFQPHWLLSSCASTPGLLSLPHMLVISWPRMFSPRQQQCPLISSLPYLYSVRSSMDILFKWQCYRMAVPPLFSIVLTTSYIPSRYLLVSRGFSVKIKPLEGQTFVVLRAEPRTVLTVVWALAIFPFSLNNLLSRLRVLWTHASWRLACSCIAPGLQPFLLYCRPWLQNLWPRRNRVV